ncbi:MAG: carboxypeptidase-like regulatory domain-containing protein [Pyrinomonadaceae bacterium]
MVSRQGAKAAKLFFSMIIVCCSLLTAHAQTTGGVKGKIRNSRGDGIAGATVTARQDSKDIKSATTNNKGEFVLDGLDEGVYTFLIDAKGYAAAVRSSFEVKKGKIRSLGDNLMLFVDRGTLVIIQGSVFFKDGTSVAGAEVKIDRVESDGSAKNITTVYTSISGDFTIRRPEGKAKYRFTAKYKGESASREIEVESAAIYRTAVSLPINRQQ